MKNTLTFQSLKECSQDSKKGNEINKPTSVIGNGQHIAQFRIAPSLVAAKSYAANLSEKKSRAEQHLVFDTNRNPVFNNAAFKALFEQAADGIFMADLTGHLLAVNSSGCKMLGYGIQEMLSLNLSDIVPIEFSQKNLVDITALQEGKPLLVERQFKKKDGSVFYAELNIQLISSGMAQAIVRDITDRKNSLLNMQKAIERYDMLSKATSDTIWDWDILNKKMVYNEVYTEMFGYPNNVINNPVEWWKLTIHQNDLDAVQDMLFNVFKNRLPNFQIEYRMRCADGFYKYILDRSFVLYNELGRPTRMIGAMQDITERKIAEEAFISLKMEMQDQHIQEQKKITRAVIRTQEKERRHLGEELHDNINQLLAGAKLFMSIEGNKDLMVKEAMTYPMQLLDDAIQEIRLLTRKTVAPNKNIDLKNQLQLLVDGLQTTSSLQVKFHCNLLQSFNSDDIKLNIYRIAQEQFNNIIKHAQASHVELSIVAENGVVKMIIVDDGIGFETNKKRTGIGLLNIIHRVESFNGKIKIESSLQNGCRIVVEMPINEIELNTS